MKRVLIVDDEEIILDVLRRIVTQIDIHADVATSGTAAMEKFSVTEYDLVLVDVLMPSKDGFQIVKEMKILKPDQRVVFVTGLYSDNILSQAESEHLDVHGVLMKPFSVDRARSVIERALVEENEVLTEDVP
jgi:two-component system alkaline phosphatase synthesis response regulator PhoP